MPSAGFEPTISGIERQQYHALERAATEIGTLYTHTQIKHEEIIKICKRNYTVTIGLDYVVNTKVGTLIVATIYLQLIQNRYMFRSFTVLHCIHQHCVQPFASDVEVVGYL